MKCTNCNSPLRATAKVCISCGNPVLTSEAAPAVPPVEDVSAGVHQTDNIVARMSQDVLAPPQGGPVPNEPDIPIAPVVEAKRATLFEAAPGFESAPQSPGFERALEPQSPSLSFLAAPESQRNALFVALAVCVVGAGVYWFSYEGKGNRTAKDSASSISATAAIVQAFATRPAVVRNMPTTMGSQALARLARGDVIQGSWVTGSDSIHQWLKITSNPYRGDYVSNINLSTTPRPAIVNLVDRDMKLQQQAKLLESPTYGATVVETQEAGSVVHVAAEIDGGWMEIERKFGGVGYVPTLAFETNQVGSSSQGGGSITSAPAQSPSNLGTATTSVTEQESRPSFQCPAKGFADEKAICENSDLAIMEDRMMSAYRDLASRQPDGKVPADAKAYARAALTNRHACGTDVGCITSIFLSEKNYFASFGQN